MAGGHGKRQEVGEEVWARVCEAEAVQIGVSAEEDAKGGHDRV